MRIVALSDLHGHSGFDIPPCDLLIVGGDICADSVGKTWLKHNPSLYQEVMDRDFFGWLGPMVDGGRIGSVVYTWGNHDWTQGVDIRNPPGFFRLVDEGITMEGIKIWGTPWSNQFMDWAWMKSPKDLVEVYANIPSDTDILISHQPPFMCGDRLPDGECVGSRELGEAIDRVSPQVVICGHIHGGRGICHLGQTAVWNVSVVDEGYRRIYDPMEFAIMRGER